MELERELITFPSGEEGRVYWPNGSPMERYASVTTVLDYRIDTGKDRAIGYWKQNNDGENGNPYWKDINEYSKWRGTIIHWYIQQHLGDLDASADEQESIEMVESHVNDYDFTRSIALNHDTWDTDTFPTRVEWLHQLNNSSVSNPLTLTDILWSDAQWACEAFADILPTLDLAATGWSDSHYRTLDTYFENGVRKSNVKLVEKKLLNTTHRYAGQSDLVYEKSDGTTVLADFKTGKNVYWGYKRQLAAYAHAIENDTDIEIDSIDEFCIIRLAPDSQETELSWLSEWDESRGELWNDFLDLNEQVQAQLQAGEVIA